MAETVTLAWGAPDMRDAIGVVQSCGENSSQENAEARSETGQVIEMRSYSQSTELSVEALVTSGKTPPKAGTEVEVDGVKYLCTSSNVTKSNTDYQKVSVTLSRKDSASIVQYSSAGA